MTKGLETVTPKRSKQTRIMRARRARGRLGSVGAEETKQVIVII